MANFKAINTTTMKMFRKKKGKCPYCGKLTRQGEKAACKHMKACQPINDSSGYAIWKFERSAPSMQYTRQGRQLFDLAQKEQRKKVLAKAKLQADPEVERYEQAKKSDTELVKQHMEKTIARGGRKSKVYVALEGLEEYLKPKYKRQLTLWKKLKKDRDTWLALEPMEKRVIDGRIKVLSHKIKEAKKQKKQKEQWAKYKNK